MKKAAGGFALLLVLASVACSVTAVRPSQSMSDMEVSMKAALEVSADTLAPEIYRLAHESALIARKEYKFKNFELAKKFADQARLYAERSEFEAIRNGAKRETVPEDPLATPSYPSEPVAVPTPIYGDSPETPGGSTGGGAAPGGGSAPGGKPMSPGH